MKWVYMLIALFTVTICYPLLTTRENIETEQKLLLITMENFAQKHLNFLDKKHTDLMGEKQHFVFILELSVYFN